MIVIMTHDVRQDADYLVCTRPHTAGRDVGANRGMKRGDPSSAGALVESFDIHRRYLVA